MNGFQNKANASFGTHLCLMSFVEYSGLEPLTSTLPFILSIKLCPLPAGFIVEAKSQ